MPLLHGIALTYQFNEVSDIATGNILTTTSASYADVPGISISTLNAVNGDVLIIHASFVVRADSGSICRGIISVNDNSSLSDVASTERTSDAAGTLLYASVVAKYTVANQPSSGPAGVTEIRLRAKRVSGAGNAYISSPVCVLVQFTRAG
jgi:hypothetical protein